MKIDQITALVIRLIVLQFFVTNFLTTLMTLLEWISGPQPEGYYYVGNYLLSHLATLLVLCLLWKYALSLARRIIPGDKNTDVKTSLSFEQLESLCFSVIGFLLTVESFSVAMQYLLAMHYQKMGGVDSRLYGAVARFALGIWITLRAKGIAKIIRKLRS